MLLLYVQVVALTLWKWRRLICVLPRQRNTRCSSLHTPSGSRTQPFQGTTWILLMPTRSSPVIRSHRGVCTPEVNAARRPRVYSGIQQCCFELRLWARHALGTGGPPATRRTLCPCSGALSCSLWTLPVSELDIGRHRKRTPGRPSQPGQTSAVVFS